MPFTAGPIEDAPKGEYRVNFKRHPWYGGGQNLQRFTAFTRGNEGGRVAFHRFAGMPESAVGSEEYRNQSNGCFRLRAKDAIRVWNFLQIGDRVLVLNNA
jgi:lipoprotein-anchoring transpeptidase ErfK/SrfK